MSDSPKQSILQAAVQLLHRQMATGETATVRNIAALAEVTPAKVRYYFQNRDELMRQAAQAIAHRDLARSVAGCTDAQIPPVVRLRDYLQQRLCDTATPAALAALRLSATTSQPNTLAAQEHKILCHLLAEIYPEAPEEAINMRALLVTSALQALPVVAATLPKGSAPSLPDPKQQRVYLRALLVMAVAKPL